MELLSRLRANFFDCCNFDVIISCWSIVFGTAADSRSLAINVKPGDPGREYRQHKPCRSPSGIQFFHFFCFA